jgi:hypothetical protein
LLGGHRDEALTSPDVLNKIIPILSEKICETIEATIKDIVDDKIKTHVDAHVHPLIETVNKQQQTITEQAQTLSKQAAIITTLQTTAKDHYGCFYCFTYFLRKDWNDFVENVRASESL